MINHSSATERQSKLRQATTIDNHDSGYLGMAVQRTLPYLDPEEQPKTDGIAEIYALFYLYMQNLNF